ncbi:hypothetical protein EVAR_24059_1 [Eumeta japonica]|uniref:Uncharacterized protein n=1 Tax=Eumeta variegata TaxID=151549 RepID=A0A4C1VU70_EUMVA|nr:hypothetical protein EVAR_24059_1 [Eumeta japonica]
MEYRCEVVASTVAFCLVNESSGSALPSPSNILFVPKRHYVLVTPVRLRMSVGGSDHQLSGGSHALCLSKMSRKSEFEIQKIKPETA